MVNTYTAKYTRIPSGYTGQLVEWPEVITDGEAPEDCRESLQDALREMIAADRQQEKELPLKSYLIKQTLVNPVPLAGDSFLRHNAR